MSLHNRRCPVFMSPPRLPAFPPSKMAFHRFRVSFFLPSPPRTQAPGLKSNSKNPRELNILSSGSGVDLSTFSFRKGSPLDYSLFLAFFFLLFESDSFAIGSVTLLFSFSNPCRGAICLGIFPPRSPVFEESILSVPVRSPALVSRLAYDLPFILRCVLILSQSLCES